MSLPNSKQYPPQSLLLMDGQGDVVATLETEQPLMENLPLNIAANDTVIINQSTCQVEALLKTKSKTVKLGNAIETGIVAGAQLLGSGIKGGADLLVKHTIPNQNPSPISPSTIDRMHQIQSLSGHAVTVSNDAVSFVKNVSGKAGTKIASAMKRKQGTNSKSWKLMRNTTLAVDAIGNGLEKALLTIVGDSKQATSQYIGHKYGEEAKKVSESVLKIVQNATLVYIDVTGVSRKAIVKGIAKSALVMKMQDGTKFNVDTNALQQGPK